MFPCSFEHGPPSRAEYLALHRQQQSEAELQRKKHKASRRGYWTQEEIDLASKLASEYVGGRWAEPRFE